MHAYLSPFPVSHQTHNATEYDSAISKCVFTYMHAFSQIEFMFMSYGMSVVEPANVSIIQSTEASGASLCSLVWQL